MKVKHAEIEREMRENSEPHDTGNFINGIPEYQDVYTLPESEWSPDLEEIDCGC
jgi:hypothetical protein